jgi:hypothetical protein
MTLRGELTTSPLRRRRASRCPGGPATAGSQNPPDFGPVPMVDGWSASPRRQQSRATMTTRWFTIDSRQFVAVRPRSTPVAAGWADYGAAVVLALDAADRGFGSGRCPPGFLAFVRAAAAALVVAEGVDRLALVHLRAALDPDLLGPPLEVVLALVLVAAGLAAAVAGLRAGVLAMRAAFSFDSPFSRSFSYCRSSFTLGP